MKPPLTQHIATILLLLLRKIETSKFQGKKTFMKNHSKHTLYASVSRIRNDVPFSKKKRNKKKKIKIKFEFEFRARALCALIIALKHIIKYQSLFTITVLLLTKKEIVSNSRKKLYQRKSHFFAGSGPCGLAVHIPQYCRRGCN